MRSQHWTLLAGMVILALLAAACAPANIAPPTSAPVAATTGAPSAPATTAATAAATTAASATVPAIAAPATNTAAPSPTVPAAPSPTSAPTATPVANAIVHLSAGTAITITSIHMLDASAGWATGGLASTGDHVLTTNDGGQTWHDVTPQQVAPGPDQGMPSAAAGFFGNATTAWVVYGNFVTAAPASAIVFRTSDGGQTWTGSQPIDLSAIGAADFFQPSDIRFLPDAKTGWFIAHLGVGMNHDYFTIMKTTDGGQTWTRLIDPTSGGPQSCQKTGLHFTDAQNGWLTATARVWRRACSSCTPVTAAPPGPRRTCPRPPASPT